MSPRQARHTLTTMRSREAQRPHRGGHGPFVGRFSGSVPGTPPSDRLQITYGRRTLPSGGHRVRRVPSIRSRALAACTSLMNIRVGTHSWERDPCAPSWSVSPRGHHSGDLLPPRPVLSALELHMNRIVRYGQFCGRFTLCHTTPVKFIGSVCYFSLLRSVPACDRAPSGLSILPLTGTWLIPNFRLLPGPL